MPTASTYFQMNICGKAFAFLRPILLIIICCKLNLANWKANALRFNAFMLNYLLCYPANVANDRELEPLEKPGGTALTLIYPLS